jgi:hypothetical protein
MRVEDAQKKVRLLYLTEQVMLLLAHFQWNVIIATTAWIPLVIKTTINLAHLVRAKIIIVGALRVVLMT